MAAQFLRRFADVSEAELVLQGGIIGSPIKTPVYGLSDKALIFSSPAGVTATFTGQLTGPVATPNGFNFVDGGGGNDSVVRNDGGSWLTDGFAVGKNLVVTNATTGANNGTFPILDASASTLEVATASFTADTDDNTATFSYHEGTVQVGVSIKDIIDQILLVTTNVAVRAIPCPGSNTYRLALVHNTGSPSAVTLTTGTANALLGFVDNQTGKVFDPPDGSAPRWLSINTSPLADEALLVVTEE